MLGVLGRGLGKVRGVSPPFPQLLRHWGSSRACPSSLGNPGRALSVLNCEVGYGEGKSRATWEKPVDSPWIDLSPCSQPCVSHFFQEPWSFQWRMEFKLRSGCCVCSLPLGCCCSQWIELGNIYLYTYVTHCMFMSMVISASISVYWKP